MIMKTNEMNMSTSLKGTYETPTIIHIVIDNEISLSLESAPIGPDEPGMGYNSMMKIDKPFFEV